MAPVITQPTSAQRSVSSALRQIKNAPGVLKTLIVQDGHVIRNLIRMTTRQQGRFAMARLTVENVEMMPSAHFKIISARALFPAQIPGVNRMILHITPVLPKQ
jgi:hypothetical protein